MVKKTNGFNVPEIDNKVLERINATYEQQIKDLRDLGDKRYAELEHSMQRQYNEEVFFNY